jgi:hypothetical protein
MNVPLNCFARFVRGLFAGSAKGPAWGRSACFTSSDLSLENQVASPSNSTMPRPEHDSFFDEWGTDPTQYVRGCCQVLVSVPGCL